MMVEYVNEPVSVEVQACRDGTARPMAFVWRGQRYTVEAWGRERSKTEKDKVVNRAPGHQGELVTWELCQDIETAQWTLTRHWARKYLAV